MGYSPPQVDNVGYTGILLGFWAGPYSTYLRGTICEDVL